MRQVQGFAARAIERDLRTKYSDRAPHYNTVRAELTRHSADSADEWSLDDDAFSVDEARAVFEELKAVYQLTRRGTRSFTPREARWIARLRAVIPDLAPGVAYWRARWHIYREDQGEPVGAVWDGVEIVGDISYALSRSSAESDATLRRALRIPKEEQR